MKIIVLNGSPRPSGNTKAMISAFTEGAERAGHEVTVFAGSWVRLWDTGYDKKKPISRSGI